METVEVPLTQGKVALIDAADWPFVSGREWCAADHDHTWYASSGYGKSQVRLHRLIVNAKSGDQVDHKNGNGLDCRRSNLRICTFSGNNKNRTSGRGASQYKGVFRSGPRYPGRPWRAEIVSDGKRYSLGTHVTEVEAARAYNAAALKHHGEFARINEIKGLTYEESVTAPPSRRDKPGRQPRIGTGCGDRLPGGSATVV